jgi:VWFA-related protein
MRLLSVLLLFSVMAPLGAQTQPTFRARTDLVEVAAVVTAPDGRPVAGLQASDFEVEEDGRPVEVTAFAVFNADFARQPAEGRFIVLLLDDTAPDLTARIKQIAHMFGDRMSGNDVMAVLSLNGSRSTTSTSKQAIGEVIDRFKPSTLAMKFPTFSRGGICPECAATSPSASGPGSGAASRSQGHVLDTITELSRRLAEVPHRRKAIVCIGDARLFDVQMPSRRLPNDWRGTIRDLSRADVSLDVIDARGLRAFDAGMLPFPADDANELARETGGRAFVNTNFFERSVDALWQMEGHYYLLGYDLPTKGNDRHSIEVRVKRAGVDVRARKSRA